MIEARHLTKRYGKTVAVDEVSFVIRPGRVTGFLGPNGAGKSTTMRMILGLDAPSSGSVLIDGKPYGELADPLRASGRCSMPRPSSAAAVPPTISAGWPTATVSLGAGWAKCLTSSAWLTWPGSGWGPSRSG